MKSTLFMQTLTAVWASDTTIGGSHTATVDALAAVINDAVVVVAKTAGRVRYMVAVSSCASSYASRSGGSVHACGGSHAFEVLMIITVSDGTCC